MGDEGEMVFSEFEAKLKGRVFKAEKSLLAILSDVTVSMKKAGFTKTLIRRIVDDAMKQADEVTG